MPVLEHGRGAGRLARTLSRLVIKNQPNRLGERVVPELQRETVFLEMEGTERLMYNCLLSLFAINAITSQRTDVSWP